MDFFYRSVLSPSAVQLFLGSVYFAARMVAAKGLVERK